MSHLHCFNHPWRHLKFLSVSPLAQLVAPDEGYDLAELLARVGVFRPWAPGPGNPDRLPHLRTYLRMPGRGPRSRFCDGTFRAVYAGKTPETCVAEVAWHHGRALRESSEPPGATRIFEALALKVSGSFVDVRKGHRELHHPEAYGPPQAFGSACKAEGGPGLMYRSVRHPGGECLALFDGQSATSCALLEVIALRWDGEHLA